MLEQRKKFYSYLIILTSLFILVFWTRNIYYWIQESIDEKQIYEKELQSKEKLLTDLKDIQSEIKSNEELEKKINKFLVWFDEKKLLKYLYDYAEENWLEPTSISFSEWWVGELGFKLWQVNLSVWFINEASMLRFIEFLIDEDAEYTFFLDKFSYSDFWDISKINTRKQMTLNLKIYYK